MTFRLGLCTITIVFVHFLSAFVFCIFCVSYSFFVAAIKGEANSLFTYI